MIKRLIILMLLASLFASCSDDEDSADPITPSDSAESLDSFDMHVIDMRADLTVLRDVKFEDLTNQFRHYPGLPENVLVGLVYLEENPDRAETLIELAIGTKMDFPVNDCSVQVFLRYHIMNPGALTDTVSSEPQNTYVKGRNIVAFRRFGQIDSIMDEITWRVVILCPPESGEVTPF